MAAQPAAGPQGGVISGTAKTMDGRPIKSFGGSIYGYSSKSGQSQTLSLDGAEGKYATDVGPGQFAIEGVVVIFGAVVDVKPIPLRCKKFQNLDARREMGQDPYRHRFAIHLAIVSAFSLRAPGVVK